MSAAREKTSGVRREWRVLYRLRAGEADNLPAGSAVPPVTGPVLSIDVVAFTASAARAKVEASGSKVIDVEEIRPLIDPMKRWLTMEESAARTGKSVRTVMRWIELGILPKCEGGNPMWAVETVDRAAAQSVGLKFNGSGELKAA
jgi:hypothetical protein